MNDEILSAVPGSSRSSPDSGSMASGLAHCVQDFESKALSRLVRGVVEKRVVDGGQREPGLVLRQ